jgi:hypothetical protein
LAYNGTVVVAGADGTPLGAPLTGKTAFDGLTLASMTVTLANCQSYPSSVKILGVGIATKLGDKVPEYYEEG